MPTISTEQILAFIKNFGLPIVILLGCSYYLSESLAEQQAERKEVTSYIRTELTKMNVSTTEALHQSSNAIGANTEALNRQRVSSEMQTGVLTKMDNTLAGIKSEVENQTALRLQAMETMGKFAEEMQIINPANGIKLDIILKRIEDDDSGTKLDVIIRRMTEIDDNKGLIEKP